MGKGTSVGAVPMTVESIRVGSVLSGRYAYRIERQLGKGGFGSVYLAQRLGDPIEGDDSAPPEKTALKVFFAPAGKDPVRYLKRELSAMLALKCDRIPRVYDWALDGPIAFVVMQYFPHGNILDASPFGVALSDASTWRLLTDLLKALKDAHSASVMHLDIKPANVLLDGNGGFVLTDFGISQGALVGRKIVAPSLGSPGYQAPEQRERRFEEVDNRTDLWGVGCTVWSMYTGIPMWLHPELFLVETESNKLGLPRLSDYRRDCPKDLEEIVMALTMVQPHYRPGGAAEVLARIRQIVSGSQVDVDTYASLQGARIDPKEIEQLVNDMVDPLWATICRSEGFDRYFVKFPKGEAICKEGDESHFTYVLLHGRVNIEVNGNVVARETREGTFLGEVATLTGCPRTATMRADTPTWTAVFNAAELEKFVTLNPAVGIRLIKSLAERLQRESDSSRKLKSSISAPPTSQV